MRGHFDGPLEKKGTFSKKKTKGQRPQFTCQIFGRPQSIYAYTWSTYFDAD